jgi:Ni/Fe-hydrogenase subunit HybB-like protein
MHELHHPPPPSYLGMTAQEITEDVLQRHESSGRQFWVVAGVLGVLLAIGVIGFIMLLSEGFDDRNVWGYYASVFAYIFLVAQSALMVSIALRMVKAHWRRPLARISELFAVVGLFNFFVYVPLLWALPVTDGRRSIWFEFPGHSPHLWDTLALGLLVVIGLALLYFASIPDLAAVRDHSTGSRHNLYRRLALNWEGSKHQWKALQVGISILGGFYFMYLVFTHMLISVDFAMSLVPGWKDAIFPAFHAISGYQAAVAIIMVTMSILRWKGGLKGYLEVDQFWGLSKLLLALSLLWFYFWWAAFFTYWYGRQPAEQSVLKFLMFETYKVPFFLAFGLSFITPFIILMWNVIRKTIWGPTLAAAIVLVGAFFNMIRFYVPAFSVEDSTLHALDVVPAVNTPGMADILVTIGALAGAVLVYMLGTRLFPIISMWEMKEGLLLQKVRTFMKIEIKVLAKPE